MCYGLSGSATAVIQTGTQQEHAFWSSFQVKYVQSLFWVISGIAMWVKIYNDHCPYKKEVYSRVLLVYFF